MEQIRALRTFIAVAEHLSFAKAARQLRMSPTTVTRAIAGLEASLGAPLLIRTTRSVHLTEQGAMFLERCRAGLAEIDDAFLALRGESPMPGGTLTITAPVMFGRLHILPIVTELLSLYPALNVRLLLLNRVVRLVEEGVDIAVRIADLPDSALHMLKIGEVQRVYSASPGYTLSHGLPLHAVDLRQHQLIVIEDEIGAHPVWQQDRSGEGATRLRVNSVEAGIDAAVAGLGIVRTLSYQVAAHWEAGTLRRVMTDAQAPKLPVSLLFQSGRRDTPNIRTFVDLARERLKDALRAPR